MILYAWIENLRPLRLSFDFCPKIQIVLSSHRGSSGISMAVFAEYGTIPVDTTLAVEINVQAGIMRRSPRESNLNHNKENDFTGEEASTTHPTPSQYYANYLHYLNKPRRHLFYSKNMSRRTSAWLASTRKKHSLPMIIKTLKQRKAPLCKRKSKSNSHSKDAARSRPLCKPPGRVAVRRICSCCRDTRTGVCGQYDAAGRGRDILCSAGLLAENCAHLQDLACSHWVIRGRAV